MDALISSLPTNANATKQEISILYKSSDEGNFCTHSQVAAIRNKGWTPYYYEIYYKYEYDGTETVSVGADGLATYCSAFDVDFSDAKEIAAYKASVGEGVVLLTKVETVAAGEGVLLRSLNGGEVTEVLPIEEATKNDDNAFVGTFEATVLKEADGNVTNFVLSKVDGVVGFFKANDTRVPAWNAYLPVENYNAEASAKGLQIVFSDATGIVGVQDSQMVEDNAFYTLSGVRVANPKAKGIYIHNGKKVIIK